MRDRPLYKVQRATFKFISIRTQLLGKLTIIWITKLNFNSRRCRMRVRCIKLINPNTGKPENSNSWLSIGKIYHVLCLNAELNGICNLRLIGDDGKTPALHDIRQFEMVSPIIPPSWKVSFIANGYFTLVPEKWSEEGFWERYFDGDPRTVQVFEEERKKIIEFDP
jgi:hypothetical protein